MDPGKAQNVRNDPPTAEVTTVGFTRAAGVEPNPSQDPWVPPAVPPTTWCPKHEGLEEIDGVEKVRSFVVEERGLLWPNKTTRSACEVWGFTTAGCGVHFIGGPSWNK